MQSGSLRRFRRLLLLQKKKRKEKCTAEITVEGDDITNLKCGRRIKTNLTCFRCCGRDKTPVRTRNHRELQRSDFYIGQFPPHPVMFPGKFVEQRLKGFSPKIQAVSCFSDEKWDVTLRGGKIAENRTVFYLTLKLSTEWLRSPWPPSRIFFPAPLTKTHLVHFCTRSSCTWHLRKLHSLATFTRVKCSIAF